jgi:uncharacterized coiled-coil protein SlyX
VDALLGNSTGNFNTATGFSALHSNTSGEKNTANGISALAANTHGSQNTATGSLALQGSTTGFDNTATGHQALFSNTTGGGNTGLGARALANNITGGGNTATGDSALFSNNTGNNNTALGINAGSGVITASNVICIGASVAGANVDDSCFIGNIYQKQVGNDSLPVRVDSFGKLGTEVSSRRFKRDIKPLGHASEGILALKPATFHYNSDPAGAGPQFGLIAEEVAEVNPDLVVRDKNGEIFTVRYDAVNAMLLNEFLKEHKKVQAHQATITELKSTVAQQQKGMEALTAQLKEQAAQIQKVSSQIEISKSMPQMVISR